MNCLLKVLPHGKGIYPAIEETLAGHKASYILKTAYLGQTEGAAGLDLRTCEDITIRPGQCLAVKTGLALNLTLDPGLGAFCLPRSGMGAKQGLILGNSIGLIDNDYQGEVIVFAWNRNTDETQNVSLKKGDRFAQICFLRFEPLFFTLIDEFSISSTRAEAGFGSTGNV